MGEIAERDLPGVGENIRVRGVGLLAVISIVLLVYLPSVTSMMTLWSMDGYRHGYLIPLISLFLLFKQRKQFLAVHWSPSWTGLGLLSTSVLLWVVAKVTYVQVVEHLALILILNTFVMTVVGVNAYRIILFPLAYLLFALPAGMSVVPALMNITADISAAGLNLMGIPVLREGMLLTLSHGVFEVADVCSGFRYLNAGLALGVLAAYLLFESPWRRIGYVAMVAVAFIVTNGVRAFAVMVVANASHMKHFVGYDHVLFGNILFIVVFLALIWLGERYSDRKPLGSGYAH